MLSNTFCIERDGHCGRAIIFTTTKASGDRLILDLRTHKGKEMKLPHIEYNYVIGFDIATQMIWLIPVDDIADNRTINLSEKKDCYKITPVEQLEALSVKDVALHENIAKITAKNAELILKQNRADEVNKGIDDILERTQR